MYKSGYALGSISADRGRGIYKRKRFIRPGRPDFPISRDLNLQYLEDGTADTIISACETLPFLAERRLVICKFLLQGEEGKKLGGYLSHVPETTLLIFFLRGKADEKLGIVKTLKKEG